MLGMARGNKWVTIPAILLTAVVVILSGCGNENSAELDQKKKVAGELRDNKLYDQAIAEYKALLDSEQLSDPQKGSVAYLIGKIYYEDMKDYESAAGYFVRARTYDPEGEYMDEVSRNLVAALEKSGRYVDAKKELENVTGLDTENSPRGSVPVAVISGDTVWLKELETQIQTLPAQMQKQMLTPEAKRDFLRQYVGMELIAESARREGLDRDPDFIMRKETLEKKLLMEKYIAEKVLPGLSMAPDDIKNYYEANKTTMYKGQAFADIQQRVAEDYRTEKSATAYMDHIAKLAEIENVTFLDNNIK